MPQIPFVDTTTRYYCFFFTNDLPSSVNTCPRIFKQTMSYPDMPPLSCTHPPREMWLGLLDSNQRFPASSGVGAQATQTLLRRPARTTYHYAIRLSAVFVSMTKSSSSPPCRIILSYLISAPFSLCHGFHS